MSQFFIDTNVAPPPLPPTVPTSFTTDVRDGTSSGPGTAVPAGNILIIEGGQTSQNNTNGIRTDANPNASNIVVVELTNRIQGTVTTVGAVTSPIITFPLGAVAGTYTIQLNVAGYESTGPSSTSYFEFICAAVSGSVGNPARIVSAGDSDEICLEDAALNPSDVIITASGNNVVISALGVAGLTIDWRAVGYYIYVS